MTFDEIMKFLEEHGSEQTKKVLRRHGAREPFFGVKIADLKKILKHIKNDQAMAERLWNTHNSDAMYLAGLAADPAKISIDTLRAWIEQAYWYLLSESAVAGIAAEHAAGWKLGLEWIESDQEMIAAAGWATLSSYISIRADEMLDHAAIKKLLDRIEEHIHAAKNRVRYVMNSFVIAAGCYIPSLTEYARAIAQKIGAVKVNMGETSCKVPLAAEYIKKVEARGTIGKKRKSARC